MGQVIDFQAAREDKKAHSAFVEYAKMVSQLTNGLDDRMVSALPWTGLIECLGRLIEFREPHFVNSELTHRLFDEEVHLKCRDGITDEERWMITARYEPDAATVTVDTTAVWLAWHHATVTKEMVESELQPLRTFTLYQFIVQLYRSDILPHDLFETPTKLRLTLKGRGYVVDVFVAK